MVYRIRCNRSQYLEKMAEGYAWITGQGFTVAGASAQNPDFVNGTPGYLCSVESAPNTFGHPLAEVVISPVDFGHHADRILFDDLEA